jgi:hypothetical protein
LISGYGHLISFEEPTKLLWVKSLFFRLFTMVNILSEYFYSPGYFLEDKYPTSYIFYSLDLPNIEWRTNFDNHRFKLVIKKDKFNLKLFHLFCFFNNGDAVLHWVWFVGKFLAFKVSSKDFLCISSQGRMNCFHAYLSMHSSPIF